MKSKILIISILFAIFAGSASVQLKTVRRYFSWTSQLSEIYTVNAKGAKHGNYKSYFEDGRSESDLNFSNGLVHGAVKRYNEFGMLEMSGHYNMGKKRGEWKEWDRAPGMDHLSLQEVSTYFNDEQRAVKKYY